MAEYLQRANLPSTNPNFMYDWMAIASQGPNVLGDTKILGQLDLSNASVLDTLYQTHEGSVAANVAVATVPFVPAVTGGVAKSIGGNSNLSPQAPLVIKNIGTLGANMVVDAQFDVGNATGVPSIFELSVAQDGGPPSFQGGKIELANGASGSVRFQGILQNVSAGADVRVYLVCDQNGNVSVPNYSLSWKIVSYV